MAAVQRHIEKGAALHAASPVRAVGLPPRAFAAVEAAGAIEVMDFVQMFAGVDDLCKFLRENADPDTEAEPTVTLWAALVGSKYRLWEAVAAEPTAEREVERKRVHDRLVKKGLRGKLPGATDSVAPSLWSSHTASANRGPCAGRPSSARQQKWHHGKRKRIKTSEPASIWRLGDFALQDDKLVEVVLELYQMYLEFGAQGSKWLEAAGELDSDRMRMFATSFVRVSTGVATRALSTFRRWKTWLDLHRNALLAAGATD